MFYLNNIQEIELLPKNNYDINMYIRKCLHTFALLTTTSCVHNSIKP